jgi:hypothetical protein
LFSTEVWLEWRSCERKDTVRMDSGSSECREEEISEQLSQKFKVYQVGLWPSPSVGKRNGGPQKVMATDNAGQRLSHVVIRIRRRSKRLCQGEGRGETCTGAASLLMMIAGRHQSLHDSNFHPRAEGEWTTDVVP